MIQQQIAFFGQSPFFKEITQGKASATLLQQFIQAILTVHLRSPKFIAFLFAVAPPGASTIAFLDNFLEELGIPAERGHPNMLQALATSTHCKNTMEELQGQADKALRYILCEPLLFGTMHEVGLAILAEVVAFECMLSVCAQPMADGLTALGFTPTQLQWFTHHGEVDKLHAEQGIEHILTYIDWYQIDEQTATTIFEMTFRDNVFLKRYVETVQQSG